jgi:methyl-accepting chemotaxis protein
MAADVQGGKGTVGKLMADTALIDEAQKLLQHGNEMMSQLQGTFTNLNAAVKSVQDGTARFPEITQALADEAKDLPGLVQQTQTSMRELERLIEAMQHHWLIRKYMDRTNSPAEPVKDVRPSKRVGK